MNDCREGRRLIAGYQTGELDADGLVKLEDHCRDCPDCRALLRTHDALLDLGDAAPLPDDRDFETVAGLVLDEMGTLPDVGDVMSYEGWRIEIVDLDGRRIDQVLVSRA